MGSRNLRTNTAQKIAGWVGARAVAGQKASLLEPEIAPLPMNFGSRGGTKHAIRNSVCYLLRTKIKDYRQAENFADCTREERMARNFTSKRLFSLEKSRHRILTRGLNVVITSI